MFTMISPQESAQKLNRKHISPKEDSSDPLVANTSCNTSKNTPQAHDYPHDYKFKNTCGMNKPPLTLSCLIFMALQEATDKCLPVREIYEWIEENFPFYRNASNCGWKSSIRHNLSFSKCFKKMDRGELVLYRTNPETASQAALAVNGRKRRAPNSTGTCWKVNAECKSYLVQTLKKSSFWFHNAANYEHLNKYIMSYPVASESGKKQLGSECRHLKSEHHMQIKEESENYEEEDTENNDAIESRLDNKSLGPIKGKQRHFRTHNNNNNNGGSSSGENVKTNSAKFSIGDNNSKKLKVTANSKINNENVNEFVFWWR